MSLDHLLPPVSYCHPIVSQEPSSILPTGSAIRILRFHFGREIGGETAEDSRGRGERAEATRARLGGGAAGPSQGAGSADPGRRRGAGGGGAGQRRLPVAARNRRDRAGRKRIAACSTFRDAFNMGPFDPDPSAIRFQASRHPTFATDRTEAPHPAFPVVSPGAQHRSLHPAPMAEFDLEANAVASVVVAPVKSERSRAPGEQEDAG